MADTDTIATDATHTIEWDDQGKARIFPHERHAIETDHEISHCSGGEVYADEHGTIWLHDHDGNHVIVGALKAK